MKATTWDARTDRMLHLRGTDPVQELRPNTHDHCEAHDRVVACGANLIAFHPEPISA